MQYILRRDNGLILKYQRCKDEPRYEYLKEIGDFVDIITDNPKDAKVFTENSKVVVHSKNWKFITLKFNNMENENMENESNNVKALSSVRCLLDELKSKQTENKGGGMRPIDYDIDCVRRTLELLSKEDEFKWKLPEIREKPVGDRDLRIVTLPVRVLFERSDNIVADYDSETDTVIEYKSGYVMRVLPNQQFVYKGEETIFIAQTIIESS